jgi:glycosyltransferase involved in cell wall biosynthesis
VPHVVIAGEAWSLGQFRGDLIRALVTAGHRVTAMAAPAPPEQVDRILALGADFRSFPVQRNRLTPVADLRTLRALGESFSSLRPDIVLAYTAKAVIWSGLALRRIRGPRYVALINGLGFTFQGEGVLRRALTMLTSTLYRASLRRAAAVVFQNTDNLDVFVGRNIVSREKCHVVDGSGVNLDYYAETPLSDGPPRFVMTTRLLREKGLREFAAAARTALRHCPEATFELLGREEHSLDAVPLSEVRGWEAEGILHYRGTAADVRPFLEACHVCVLPSYHEGLPRSLLEAMAVGRLILTTDVPGCRETVVPGRNGFVVPKGDPAALADRMIWLLDHRDQWAAMGRASRRLAEARFDVRKVNADMLRLLGILAGSPV